MASNFHEAGLSILLHEVKGTFTAIETAVLTWLYEGAKVSSATYWDLILSIATGSPFDRAINSVKDKCRYLGLGPRFEELAEQYRDKRGMAA